MAYTSRNELENAEKELVALKEAVADPSLKETVTFSSNTGEAILRIAPEVVAGEIGAKRKDWDRALLHLERAVRYEDSLIYQEPADWHAPVRLSLAAVLLEAGRPVEAEAVYWEELKRNPETGWTLFGLAQALRAEGKDEEAAAVDDRFKKAWTEADVTLTSSRIGGHSTN
jgi:tetratricopeptide (TPR) repeat protein